MIVRQIHDVVHAIGTAARAYTDVRTVSLNTLHRLLRKMSRTSFGREHGLNSDTNIEQFRSAVPIRGYADYTPWISRIKMGELDVLWPGKPNAFASTSGTTNENKLIPITEEFLQDYHTGSVLTFARMCFSAPRLLTGKILTLGGPSEESRLNGIPVGSITGLLYRNLPKSLDSRLAVPCEVNNIQSYNEKLYLIARLALEAPITGIIAVIPGSLLTVSDAINAMARELIEEIANGSLRELNTVPENLNTILHGRLTPNIRRAKELRAILDKYKQLPPKLIWPVRGLCTYTKQGHPSQWERIRQMYGELNIIDSGLVASEGRVSVGLFPGKKHHAVIPGSSFVEFLPRDLGNLKTIAEDEPLLPHELEKGRYYTPVISSANGLMRYRLEDVIYVDRMVGEIPIIEYTGRLDDSLSVAGEKVCEVHFREAIDRLRILGYSIENSWAVGIEWSGQKPFYVLFWETPDKVKASDISEDLDRELQKVNVSYRRKREQLLLLPALAAPIALGELGATSTKISWLGQSKECHILKTRTVALLG